MIWICQILEFHFTISFLSSSIKSNPVCLQWFLMALSCQYFGYCHGGVLVLQTCIILFNIASSTPVVIRAFFMVFTNFKCLWYCIVVTPGLAFCPSPIYTHPSIHTYWLPNYLFCFCNVSMRLHTMLLMLLYKI